MVKCLEKEHSVQIAFDSRTNPSYQTNFVSQFRGKSQKIDCVIYGHVIDKREFTSEESVEIERQRGSLLRDFELKTSQ